MMAIDVAVVGEGSDLSSSWSYLDVLLDLLMFLLRSEELRFRESLPQCLLGHERLQLQQSRHPAVLADETGAVGVKMDW